MAQSEDDGFSLNGSINPKAKDKFLEEVIDQVSLIFYKSILLN